MLLINGVPPLMLFFNQRSVFLFITYLWIMMLNGEICLCLKSISSDEDSDTDLKHC